MAADDELIRLVMQVQGQDQAENLRKKVEELRAKILGMGAAASATDPKVAAWAREMKAAADQADKLDKQFGRSRSGMAGFGQSALQTGRVMQDFAQGGIGGIINNLEGLTQALGGGPGLAGVMTLVGVGFLVAKPYLAQFAEAIGLTTKAIDPFKTEISTLTDRIKALTDKPVKLAVEMDELDAATAKLKKLGEAKAAFEQLTGTRPDAETAAGKTFTEKLREAPGGVKAAVDAVKADQMRVEFRKNPEDTLRQEEINRLQAKLQIPEFRDKKLPGPLGKDLGVTEGDVIEAKIRELQKVQDEVLKRAETKANQNVETTFGGAAHGDPKALEKATGMMATAGVDARAISDTLDAIIGADEKVAKARKEEAEQRERTAKQLDYEKKQKADMLKIAYEQLDTEKKQAAFMAQVAAGDERRIDKGLAYEAQQKGAMAAVAKADKDQELANHLGGLQKKAQATAAAQSNAAMGRMANASGLSDPIDRAMMEAQQKAQMDPQFQRQFRPKVRRWADMSAAERKDMAAQGRAGRNQMTMPTMEEQEQMVAGRNAEDDQKLKGKVAKQLLKDRVVRDPAQAAGMAEMMVNRRREAMNEANGDQPVDKNTKMLETLNDTLKELARKGIMADARAS